MGKITYNDKVKINELTDVPAINKVQDVDMNEIKASVNDLYDALGTGTDTYSTSTSYVVGDMVIYNGMIYKCINATSGAWNPVDWSSVSFLSMIYPVGSIYMSVNSTNPSTLFGGTWVAWGTGRVPVGVDTSQTEFNTVEKTGGSKYLQQHQHYGLTWNGIQGESISLNNGSSTGYSLTYQGGIVSGQEQSIQTYPAGTGDSGNLQPYITCYMWKRTA